MRQFRTPGSVRGEGSAASAVTPSPARSIALQAFEVGARFRMASKMIALVFAALVDNTHPPATELLNEPVVRDSLADHRKFSTSMRSCLVRWLLAV